MKKMIWLLLALLLVTAPSTATAQFDPTEDSVGVLTLTATSIDTAITYDGANYDHAAGATISTDNIQDQRRDIYERWLVRLTTQILSGGDTLDWFNVAANCEDTDTFTNYCLDCCTTAVCTTAYNVWLDDSTSYQDSVEGYLRYEQTNNELDDTIGTATWNLLDSTTIVTGPDEIEKALTVTQRFLRFTTVDLAATETGDTIYTVIWVQRGNSWEPYGDGYVLWPDYMGNLSIQGTAPAHSDTIDTWPNAGIDHSAGERMRTTYGDRGGDFYTKLIVTMDPLTTASADEDSVGGHIVLSQSFDGENWFKSDSTLHPGGLAAASKVIHIDTLNFARAPYWRLNTQDVADSTDASTGVSYSTTTQRLK